MAQNDLRALLTAASATNGEQGRAHQERLVIELGTVQTLDKVAPAQDERDQTAFNELKTMAAFM